MAKVNVIKDALLNAAMLRWMNELAPQGIITTDPELKIRGWNQWLEQQTGRTSTEMVGRNLLEAYPELVERRLDRYYRDALEGQVRVLSQRLHKFLLPVEMEADAAFTYMQQSARISPLLHDDEVIGTVTVIDDVTERITREAELQEQIENRARLLASEHEARKQAEAANRLKDEFLATVSHELRTPLTAILGWSRMLRSGQLGHENLNHALETIERNAKAQSQLIEDLLDVTRIITGKLRLDVRPVELPSVIESAIDSIRLAADAKDIQLQVILDTGPVLVMGDPDRLQQVIWNLLSNAIKFTSKGGRVQIMLLRVGSQIEVVVKDSGQGISADVLPYIFDRFRQADSSTTRLHSGLGLGLAIVRHLMELHGGTVEAASAGIGQGSTFTVKIPLLATHSSQLSDEDRRAHPHASNDVVFDCPPQLEGLNILVVDDEEDSRNLVATVLERCKARVTTVGSVAEALEALERLRPDVLLSDLGMPDQDGYELIKQVRALPAERGGHTPAGALTAYARVEDRMRVLRSGFQIHVPKPVEPAELVTVVANLAERNING